VEASGPADFRGLPAPARRALAAAGFRHLEDVATATAAQVGALHGIGPGALDKLRDKLGLKALSFADEA
jgi:hypothetical protein